MSLVAQGAVAERLGWGARDWLSRPLALASLPLGLAAAAVAGWAIGHGSSLVLLALAMLIPVAVVGPRLRPVHWIVGWLTIAGLLAWAPGPTLAGGPELTAERLLLLLVVAFTGSRYLLAVG